MKGSIDGIKCMFIDLLTGREGWKEKKGMGEERIQKNRGKKRERTRGSQ